MNSSVWCCTHQPLVLSQCPSASIPGHRTSIVVTHRTSIVVMEPSGPSLEAQHSTASHVPMASPPPPGAPPRTESIASFLARLSLKLSAPYDQYLQALTDGGLENIAELRQLAVADLVELKIPRLRASVMIRAASEVHTCLFRLADGWLQRDAECYGSVSVFCSKPRKVTLGSLGTQ